MSAEQLDWARSPLGPYANVVDHQRAYDEVIGPDGIRTDQLLVSAAVEGLGLSGLLAARAEAQRLVADDGVHYGGSVQQRPWAVDPLPMVLSASDWAGLEQGLQQRLRLLEALLADIYGDQRLLHEGVVPTEIILGHGGFLHQAHGIATGKAAGLTLAATDLGRGSDGEWFALGDRTANPSGAGYAMVNRRLTSRVMADLHRGTHLRRLRGFFDAMRRALLDSAPPTDRPPRGAMLWSGSASETAYEQGFLAALLGFSLVEAEDLEVRDGALWIQNPERRGQVDVILRRIDDIFCDPLEWRADSELGVAGLLEASRQGRVSVVNRLGAGVLENAALLRFLPDAAQALLGEDLLLPSTDTWWCGDPDELSHVLANLDQLVIKPIERDFGTPSRAGWLLSEGERDQLAGRIKAQPWAWVGQDPILTSTTPIITREGLEPRRTILRTFAVAEDDQFTLMPGGLARVAPDQDTFLISSMSGALSKDVWVLDDDQSLPATLNRPLTRINLAQEFNDPRPLPSRVADNLFWYGRYTERVDGTARLLSVALDLSEDFGDRPGHTRHDVLEAVFEALSSMTGLPSLRQDVGASSRQVVRRASADPTLVGSLAHDIGNLQRCAHEVPDILSADVWPLLGQLAHLMADGAEAPDLDAVRGAALGLAGINAESMVRDNTWAFIDAGVRIERAVTTLWLLDCLFSGEVSMLAEDQIAEMAMLVGDSLITHHRRAAVGAEPARPGHAAVALLVADPTNPRSVAFQLARLSEDLVMIEDQHCADRVQDLLSEVGALTQHVTNTTWEQVRDQLKDAEQQLRALSDEMFQRHFRRTLPRVFTTTSWLSPVEPRLRG